MFKTAKEFESAMYKVLVNIRDGRIYPKDFDFEIEEQDANDVVKKLLDYDFVLDVMFLKGTMGYKAPHARLSYEGLKFIEKYEATPA